jgi:hypothetical protein
VWQRRLKKLGKRGWKKFRQLAVWQQALVVVVVPLLLINLGVAYFGDTRVFLLSPYFLKSKVKALGAYAAHRPVCLVTGHPELEPVITAAERRHGIPRHLLGALIQVESATRVHRISPAGAMGPGQLIPSSAVLMGVKDPFDSAQAVDGSARYLKEQLRRFGSVRLAVAAYNAGPGAVRGAVPRNGETEHYVPRVMAEYHRRSRAGRPSSRR